MFSLKNLFVPNLAAGPPTSAEGFESANSNRRHLARSDRIIHVEGYDDANRRKW